MKVSPRVEVNGYVSEGFEAVRDTFIENFSRRGELGAAFCVYYQGEKVVDLWGGVRNKETGEPWEEDTMILVHSTTKGLSAMTLALAHSRGWLDYDAPVCHYWPEFAQEGKGDITVRHLLAHQAGLYAFGEPVDRATFSDLDKLAVVLARQKPAHAPATRQAYHGISLGFYQNELMRRVHPRHHTIGQVFQEEIATPLGLDFYIRLPESIPDSRLARFSTPSPLKMLVSLPIPMTLATFNRRSILHQSLISNPGTPLPMDDKRVYSRNLESPSGSGVGTARAIAHAYGVFATGGKELNLRAETLEALKAPAIPSQNGFYDDFMLGEAKYSLGFLKPNQYWHFGSESAFGTPGTGGSLGFADPEVEIGYGYVMNRIGTTLTGDPREVALRNATRAIIRRRQVARTAHGG